MAAFRPSKQFLIRGAIAVGIVGVVLVMQTPWVGKLLHRNDSRVLGDTTIGDIVSQDTNGNGIADWEERLWGLDPTVLYTNGIPNAEIIRQKKVAAGVDTSNSEPQNDTDRLARELFTLTTALSQNDAVDDTTLQNIAGKLGSTINIKQIGNHYSLKQLKTVTTTPESLTAYYRNIVAITKKYNKESADIEVVVEGLETGDFSRLSELTETATLYKQYSKELSSIPVPIGLAGYDLDVINGFYGVASSFTYLQGMEDNSIESLAGVAAYQTYSQRISTGFYNIDTYLTRYGILVE
jgi:hypothetical protein